MPYAKTRKTERIHTFTSGPFVAVVEENPADAGRSFQLVIHNTLQPAEEPVLIASADDLRSLANVCAGAVRLVEYLSYGFPYEAWREDYDPARPPNPSDA